MKPKTLTILAAALSTLALLGCGSEDGDDGSGGDGIETTEEPTVKLAFSLRPMGAKGSTEGAELICPSDDSGLEDGCEAVQSLPSSAFEPVPAGKPCTEIFGGADQLLVQGMLDGESITVSLNRAGGCEIARFEDWMPIVEELYPGYEPGGSIQPPQ